MTDLAIYHYSLAYQGSKKEEDYMWAYASCEGLCVASYLYLQQNEKEANISASRPLSQSNLYSGIAYNIFTNNGGKQLYFGVILYLYVLKSKIDNILRNNKIFNLAEDPVYQYRIILGSFLDFRFNARFKFRTGLNAPKNEAFNDFELMLSKL